MVANWGQAPQLIAQNQTPQEITPDRDVNFNPGWKFLRLDQGQAGDFSPVDFDDSKWEGATLPHTAKVEPLNANNMWQGVCWYRKHFTVGPNLAGKKIFIDFEGAMSVADVFVNGKKVTTHYGGYLPFEIDLTSLVKPGDNVIAVQLANVDNGEIPPGQVDRKLDFDWYSGLYRDVTVHVTDPLHITDPVGAGKVASGGIFVTYPEATADEATVQIALHVANDSADHKNAQAQFQLVDRQGQIVTSGLSQSTAIPPGGDAVLTQQLKVPHPQLWDPGHPYLYQLRTTLSDGSKANDALETRIGVRRISFSASGGFQINGHRMYLRGCDRHQEYAYLGYALSDNAQYRDAVKIKSAGFDFIRTSHYPQSPAFLDACDELGLVVMDAIPGWQYMGDDVFRQRSFQTGQEMIRRDRNHPCVVLWETSLNETAMDSPFMDQMRKNAHAEYPGDQCYTAGWMDDFDVFLQARQHGDCYGYKNGDKASLVSEYGDWEYFAGNAGLDQTAMKDLKGAETNSRQSRADGERRLWIQSFNFQQGANANRGGAATGDAIWVMYDYSRGCDPSLETSGIMDNLRIPKFAYYFFQSQRDANETPVANEVETGPMVSIASWWNDQSLTNVTVFSNCEEVELSLNGQVIARQKPDQNNDSQRLPHPPFTFKIGSFKPGTLKAVGYIQGNLRASDTVSTAGNPVALHLTADFSGRLLTADGADAIFIYADAIDAQGNVVRGFNHPISFHVTGPAGLVGENPISATAGTAGIVLQAGLVPGPIAVQATADGLQAGEILVNSAAK
jgi:beta-galactosidase